MPVLSRLQPLNAPDAEPITLDLAKRHLRLDNDDDDELLPVYIAGARAWAEDYLGRALATQQFMWTIHQEQYAGAYPYLALPFPVTVYPLWYPWPEITQGAIDVPRAPLISVDSVGYGVGSTETTLTSDKYSLDPVLGRVRIKGGSVPSASDHLSFKFTAGYPGVIPPGVKAALLMLTALLYENRGDQAETSDAFGVIPNAARMLLTPHRRVTFGG